MAVNLIDSNDITINQTGNNIELNTSVNLTTLNNNVNQLQTQVDNLSTYSTTEQRIGTWIDGKPLYRKVIEKTSGISTGSNAISHGISNLKEVVSASGYYVRADSNQGTIPRISDQSVWMVYFGDITSTIIRVNVGTNYVNTFALSKVYVVIEYTKTTD